MKKALWTVGHSTRPLSVFAALMRHHGIETVADVRAFPGSRRYPHFHREAMRLWLPQAGIRYVWLGEALGGRRRRVLPGSPNAGLRNASFRNYADHMQTPEFSAGIDALLELAAEGPTAIMCSELLWWRCHRSLIADYLSLMRSVSVRHIAALAEPKIHAPHIECRRSGQALIYGAPARLT
jgi:uncharacterized protein (DUF488 family)